MTKISSAAKIVFNKENHVFPAELIKTDDKLFVISKTIRAVSHHFHPDLLALKFSKKFAPP